MVLRELISHSNISWFCENGFLIAISHQGQSLKCDEKFMSSKTYQLSSDVSGIKINYTSEIVFYFLYMYVLLYKYILFLVLAILL